MDTIEEYSLMFTQKDEFHIS